MEYHRDEDTDEGVELPIETEENTSTSSEDQEESLPGDSAIKLETVEAWPENQKKRKSEFLSYNSGGDYFEYLIILQNLHNDDNHNCNDSIGNTRKNNYDDSPRQNPVKTIFHSYISSKSLQSQLH